MNPFVSLVVVNWNRCSELQECLESLQNQSYTNCEIIVVDNLSTDGSIELVREKFPQVKLIVMPDSSYGACETFNIGFVNARGDYIGILDNDITLPKNWVESIIKRFEKEPDSTAIISTKVIEPGMPEEYLNSKDLNKEKYIDTFVGCGSIAKSNLLKEAGYYDNTFFIHVNEKDLALSLLNKGYHILHFPDVLTFHKKPFGIHVGNRSLYYHVRNYIWVLVKHYSLKSIFLFTVAGFQIFIPLKFKNKGVAKDNLLLGTVGLKAAILFNKGGKTTTIKAIIDAFLGLPYCIRKRSVCKSPDLRMPFKN